MFGVVEVIGGVVGIITPEPATTVGGVLLVANGADNAQAGFRQVWSGEVTNSVVEAGIQAGATAVGLPPATVELTVAAAGMLGNPTKIFTKGDDAIDAIGDINRANKKSG